MKTSNEIKQISVALANASKELKNPFAGTENPFYKSKYTSLEDLIEHVKNIYSKFYLFIIQSPELKENNIIVYTRIMHLSGEWIENETGVPAGKDAQKTGAAITYGRRYGLAAICNISSDADNDGNELVAKKENFIPGKKDKFLEMPDNIKQLFKAKGYTENNKIRLGCETLNYDWKAIENKLNELGD